MKTIIANLVIAIFLFSCNSAEGSYSSIPSKPPVYSSGGSGGSGSGASTDPNQTDVPIDGGLSILLVAGAAYGVKRFRNMRQKENV